MSTDGLVRRAVRWTDADGRGLEHCLLTLDDGGLTLEGVVAGPSVGAHYLLRADPLGRTRMLRLRHVGGPDLHLAADENARWRDEITGRALPELDGCLDLDLAFTPATNTLPIRRLALKIGQSADIRVAYVPRRTESDPAARLRPVVQRYHRLAPRVWRYHQPDAGFTADLPVDDLGLVCDYPELFRRVDLP